ncbi:hypothetical protein HK097_002044 [Rhizophlyctis rosea]|uniref:NmrA-like domain-containing protein n=1 Tax=Rhizophlyctis rosea TaxID=64517 RepID=A0AAD5S3X5_9FUNG|nr:hypothetical protein HK097_002044 [Rhizophlyctis rosea]
MSSVLVAGGSGGLGAFLVKALSESPKFSTVKILARPDNSHKAAKAAPARVEIVRAEYTDHAGLLKALHGVDIVISALNGIAAGDPQIALIKAAKEANVKKFVPTEFGVDPSRQASFSFYADKLKAQQALRDASLAYTLYGTGLFPDTDLAAWFGFDIENNKITLVGDGNQPISWTLREDVARFVVDTVLEESSNNKVVNIEGDVKTANEVVALLEKKKGVKFDVIRKDPDQALAEAKATGNPGIVAVTEIQVGYATGFAKVSNPSELSFKPKSVEAWVNENVRA